MSSRDRFEEWAKSQGMDRKILHNIGWTTYIDPHTQSHWEAWQASRAAMVVELPIAFDASKDDATYYLFAYKQSDIEKALDAAGVPYQ